MRLPARTARLRLTLLYGGLFLACGVVLVTLTYVLSEQAIANRMVRAPGSGVPSLGPVPVHPAEPAPGSPQQVALLSVDRQVAAQRASDLHHLLLNSGIALAIVAVLAILLGWYVAGRVLRPVTTITATARRISATNLHERLALDDADEEFRQLGDTLDDLFARLEAAFQAQRHFVANASHELRTPLAWEQMVLQVALADPNASSAELRESCEKVLAASKQQQGLVEALLTLATSAGELGQREPIDLSGIAATALREREPDVRRGGLEINAALEPAPTSGHRALVERLLANLIDNAIRHNAPGGHVRVETGSGAGSSVRLLVANSGPEIPPAEIERLFEPFQRLPPGRTNGHAHGYGLGLSIVRAIANAHRAELTARPRSGGGLSVEVRFPAASDRSGRLPEQPGGELAHVRE